MDNNIFWNNFPSKKNERISIFTFEWIDAKRIHQNLNTCHVIEILFIDHLYQCLPRICLSSMRTEVNHKKGLHEPWDRQGWDISEDVSLQRDKWDIERRVSTWSAGLGSNWKKRWLSTVFLIVVLITFSILSL